MLDKPHSLWSVSIKITPTATTGKPGVLREGFILLTERLKRLGWGEGRGHRAPDRHLLTRLRKALPCSTCSSQGHPGRGRLAGRRGREDGKDTSRPYPPRPSTHPSNSHFIGEKQTGTCSPAGQLLRHSHSTLWSIASCLCHIKPWFYYL